MEEIIRNAKPLPELPTKKKRGARLNSPPQAGFGLSKGLPKPG
jgi:hypothetical protein